MLPYSNTAGANALAALHNVHAHVCFIAKMLGMIAQPCVCRHESLQKLALLVWVTRPRLMKVVKWSRVCPGCHQWSLGGCGSSSSCCGIREGGGIWIYSSFSFFTCNKFTESPPPRVCVRVQWEHTWESAPSSPQPLQKRGDVLVIIITVSRVSYSPGIHDKVVKRE